MSGGSEKDLAELKAGSAFRDTLIARADSRIGSAPLWHGWAIMDAFLAGIKWQKNNEATVLANARSEAFRQSQTVNDRDLASQFYSLAFLHVRLGFIDLVGPMIAAARAEGQKENPRDWREDFTHENGNYECSCCLCGGSFTGHKRRVVCKLCNDYPEIRQQGRKAALEEAASKFCTQFGHMIPSTQAAATVRSLIDKVPS